MIHNLNKKHKKELFDNGYLVFQLDEDFKKFVAELKRINYITEILTFGRTKFNGLAKLDDSAYHRRIDILYTPVSEFVFALLYFTGSGPFNTAFRKISSKMVRLASALEKTVVSPEVIADRVMSALTKNNNKPRYRIDSQRFQNILLTLLPKRMADKMIAKQMGLNKK